MILFRYGPSSFWGIRYCLPCIPYVNFFFAASTCKDRVFRELVTNARRGYVDRATAYGWAQVLENSATEDLINVAYKNEEVD